MDQPTHEDDRASQLDILQILDNHWRSIIRIAIGLTALVALVAAVYLVWLQPTLRTVALEFRPTFAGASKGEYPNGLLFAPSDVTASSIVDQVFDSNNIQQYCDRDAFKSAFVVEQRSSAYAFLDADYQARLSDSRLTSVDRERIQAEYQAKRTALPLRYQLVFATQGDCRTIPLAVVTKSLSEILAVWAEQSESRRGVLKLQVQVLTPNVLEVGLRDDGSRLIRADLIRSGLRRIQANVRTVEGLPGASLVRVGEGKLTFAEVRTKIEDLIQSRLDPLVVMAGRGLGTESLAWVDEALSGATQEQISAEGKARSYLNALREYSGMAQPGAPAIRQPSPSSSSSDVQSLTPQIDRTFIDRILEMSEANTAFRQELTREMVEADVQAVESRAKVGYYEHLASALRRPQGGGLAAIDVDTKLQEIVRDGKVLAQQFNDLYDEWSRVSLRPAGALYQVDNPAHQEVSRPFTRTSFLLTVLGAFVVILLVAIVIFLIQDRIREAHIRRASSPAV